MFSFSHKHDMETSINIIIVSSILGNKTGMQKHLAAIYCTSVLNDELLMMVILFQTAFTACLF